MHLLTKFKYIFLFLFIISSLFSLYYYFYNYSTVVKKQFIESETKINIHFKSNSDVYLTNYSVEDFEKRLSRNIDRRAHKVKSSLAKNFKIREDQVKILNYNDFLVNHNYSFDLELMEGYFKNFFNDFLTTSNTLKEINNIIQNNFYRRVGNVRLLNLFMKERGFEVFEFDDYFEIKISYDNLNIYSNRSTMDYLLKYMNLFAITDLLINEEKNIIVKKPKLITADDFTADIFNTKEKTMVITGYNIFYYLLIVFSFINILIYLYIYLRQKKYI
jgi:hypothetical protein